MVYSKGEMELEETLVVLERGGTILYPTDTIWGIGCDATNADAVDKLYSIKSRHQVKTFICLVSDLHMLSNYISDVPAVAYDIIKISEYPTTIVYENPRGVSENLIAEDKTLAVRVVKESFCNSLIRLFGKPIVSTSANISGSPSPKSFREITSEILENIDYIVNLHHKKSLVKPSSIIKVSADNKVKIIRG